ncbi:MAG TPA: DUF4430 domain-containing protein [Thermoplasmata archaeon]|nr:DUF4430 domain-containing protein [Thermoplasmata archaeon]
MKQSYKLAAVLVAFVIAVGIATALYEISFNGKENNKVTATVSIYFGNGTLWTFPDIETENATVFGFLIEAASKGNFTVESTYYSQYDSMFVDSIASVENGENNKYWQYYINGNYGTLGADRQPVKNGDIIEWRFEGFG